MTRVAIAGMVAVQALVPPSWLAGWPNSDTVGDALGIPICLMVGIRLCPQRLHRWTPAEESIRVPLELGPRGGGIAIDR